MTTATRIINNLHSTIRAACRKTTASLESSSPPVRRVAFQRNVVRSLQLSFFALTFLFLCATLASAKIWYIKVDGTGDAPTIQAGVDSAAAGDTVLVGPGVFELDRHIIMKDGIVLTSESGAANTTIKRGMFHLSTGIRCTLLVSSGTEISGFWIEGFNEVQGISSGIYVANCENVIIKNNIITKNCIGIGLDGYNYVSLQNNTLNANDDYDLYRGGGAAINNIFWGDVFGFDNFSGLSSCNDFKNISHAGIWITFNFSQDPEFCGIDGSDNYYLQSDSPCAPGNPPMSECGLIGALPVGCGTTPVEHKTWGAVKAIYKKKARAVE